MTTEGWDVENICLTLFPNSQKKNMCIRWHSTNTFSSTTQWLKLQSLSNKCFWTCSQHFPLPVIIIHGLSLLHMLEETLPLHPFQTLRNFLFPSKSAWPDPTYPSFQQSFMPLNMTFYLLTKLTLFFSSTHTCSVLNKNSKSLKESTILK